MKDIEKSKFIRVGLRKSFQDGTSKIAQHIPQRRYRQQECKGKKKPLVGLLFAFSLGRWFWLVLGGRRQIGQKNLRDIGDFTGRDINAEALRWIGHPILNGTENGAVL